MHEVPLQPSFLHDARTPHASVASLASLLTLAACAKSLEPPLAPAFIDVAKADAAGPLVEAPAPALVETYVVPATFDPPPTGEYEIATALVSDTCAPRAAAPPPVTGLVVVRPGKDRVGGSFEFPEAAPPPVPHFVRSEVRLDVAEPTAYTKNHVSNAYCARQFITNTVKALEVTRDRVEISRVCAYGAASPCPLRREPTSCKREYVYTYTLKTKLCDPRCPAQLRQVDGGLDVECNCP